MSRIGESKDPSFDSALRVRLLGTAAGGGFPQWNCNCSFCQAARSGDPGAPVRAQSSAAVSADGKSWFLLNASPDVRHQIEAFPELRPPPGAVRGSALEGVLITNADLDHVLGLFILREGNVPPVYAPPAVRQALDEGLRLSQILGFYGGIRWQEPPPSLQPLLKKDGSESGLLYEAFEVPGKLPRYAGSAFMPGSAVGYHFVDARTKGRLVFLPDTAGLDETALLKLRDCDALILDGTFFTDDEMVKWGTGTLSATQMAHLPVGGASGSLEMIKSLPAKRKIYMHINNTNPILNAQTPEARLVREAGVEVGVDGTDFSI